MISMIKCSPSLIVIIPIYTEKLKAWELLALDNNMRILHDRAVCFLIPQGLDIRFLRQKYHYTQVVEVSTDWLGIKRGRRGYNEMMMSAAFYDIFHDYEYMMIVHLDTWLFSDDLSEWLRKGYDLVAAPWPIRPRYNHFPFRQYLKMENFFLKMQGKAPRTLVYGLMGNGGLCLRNVAAFQKVCKTKRRLIQSYIEKNDETHNEDIFFALEAHELKTPTVEDALTFAWDVKPKLCYFLNHKKLPMGCHGFMHNRRKNFWAKFINIPCLTPVSRIKPRHISPANGTSKTNKTMTWPSVP